MFAISRRAKWKLSFVLVQITRSLVLAAELNNAYDARKSLMYTTLQVFKRPSFICSQKCKCFKERAAQHPFRELRGCVRTPSESYGLDC